MAAWMAVLLFTGLNLLNFFDRCVMPAVLTPMKITLKMNDSEAGWASAAFMFGYFLSAPLFGYLGDRYSRRNLMLAGVVVWSFATAATGLAQDLGVLIAVRVLVGVGEACFIMICPAWISDLFPAAQRNNALTVFYLAVPFGAAMGYEFGGQFATEALWRYSFFFAGIPSLLLMAGLFAFPEPKRGGMDDPADLEDVDQGDPNESSFTSLMRLLSNGRFQLLTWGYTALVFALGAFQFWAPAFLERVHGMPLTQADSIFSIMLAVTGLVATIVGGLVGTKLRRITKSGYAWVLLGAIAPAAPLALLAFLAKDTTVCLVALGLCMFLVFLPTAPCTSQLFEIVPARNRAKANGVMTFFMHLFGDVLSPILVGYVSDRSVSLYVEHPEQSLQLGLLILPVALAVGALLWGGLVRATAIHKH